MTGDKHHGDFDLDVVITNWNSGDQLRRCIGALDQSTIAPRLHVTIVDNSSVDGSVGDLKSEKLDLKVIYNAANRGFAAACNQGAARGCAPLLLFLNPDTRVEPDAL